MQPLPAQPAISVATTIPTLSSQQSREIFRLMIEEYGLGQSVMLENVGRSLTGLVRRLIGGNLNGQLITILAGAGHCGAAGLVAARYLTTAGAEVSIILSRPPDMLGPTATHQHRMLTRMGQVAYHQIPALRLSATLRRSVLVLDTLIGGGLHGWPTGSEAFLLQAVRQTGRPVLALDLPSGLPADGEKPPRPELVIQAKTTLALALPRLAHAQPANFPYIGELYLADIGVPPHLYARLGLMVGSLFGASDLILLRRPAG